MNSWIKLYIEALHDRKMRRLNRFDKSVFYDLLLLAGQEGKDGELPCIEDIALELDLKPSEAQKSVNALIKAGLLSQVSNDNFMITKFKERQESNMTGYERVKRYRDNRKPNTNDNADDNAMITDDNSGYVINDNADDTQMITLDKDIDKDKEIDKEEDKEEDKEREIKREKKREPAQQKHRRGEHKRVLLTDAEVGKLAERFPDSWQKKIQKLDDYLQQHQKKSYDDHYLTICKWAADDEQKKPVQQEQRRESWSEIAERLQAEEEAEGVSI